MHTYTSNKLTIYSLKETPFEIKTKVFYATENGIFYTNNFILSYFSYKQKKSFILQEYTNKILSIFCSEYLFVAFDGIINKYSIDNLEFEIKKELINLLLETKIEYNNTVTYIFTNDIYLYIISPYLDSNEYKLDIMPNKTSYDKINPLYGKCYESSSFLLTYNVMIYILINKELEFLINMEEILRNKLIIYKLDIINNILIILIDIIINKEDDSSDNIIIKGRKKIKIKKEEKKEIHLIDLNIKKSIKKLNYNNYSIFKEKDKYLLLIENNNQLIKEDLSDFIRTKKFIFKKTNGSIKSNNEISLLKGNKNKNKNLEKLFYKKDVEIIIKEKKENYLLNNKEINYLETECEDYRYLKYKDNGNTIILKRVIMEYDKYKPKLFNLIINQTILIPLEIPFESQFKIISVDYYLNICVILLSNNNLNILNMEYLCKIKNILKLKKIILNINRKNILKIIKLKYLKELNISKNKIDNRIDFFNEKLIVSTDNYINYIENIQNIFNIENEDSINSTSNNILLKSIYLENIIQQKVSKNNCIFITENNSIFKLKVLLNEIFLEEELEGEIIDFFIFDEFETLNSVPWFLSIKIYLIVKINNQILCKELIKCPSNKKVELINNKNILEVAQYISAKPNYLEILEINYKDFIPVFFQSDSLFGYLKNQLNELMDLKRISKNKLINKSCGRKGKSYNPFL